MMTASTAREALIVELIGDVAALLDRVEALGPTIDKSRQASVKASAQLTAQLEGFESRVAAVSGTVQARVVHHILLQTQEAARRAQEIQSRAIAETAREAFRGEVERAIQYLARAMQAVNAAKPPVWEAWLTHAATAVAASAVTSFLIFWSYMR
jgi:hypothetical protein